MSKVVRTRISSLSKDISFLRLDKNEIEALYFNEETMISIDSGVTHEIEQVISVVEGEEGYTASFTFSKQAQQRGEYADLLELLVGTVVSFTDKIVPDLLDMEPTEAVAVIDELYHNAVMFNPAIRPMDFSVFVSQIPMEDTLEEMVVLLPESMSPLVMTHGYREYFDDELFDIDADDIASELERRLVEPLSMEVAEPESEMEIDVDKVRGLKGALSARVIGQSYAIEHVYAVARRLAIGFRDKSRPPAVLLFVGETGVGKTLLAKELSKYLFGDDKPMGRIDCAALSEKFDTAKLFGPPPGYVGFPHGKDGESVKEQDPSILYKEAVKLADGGVILFDEIEKAHPDVWDAMLTIFDEGYIKTSVGNIVDFRNCIIILTSNLGTKELDDRRRTPIGFTVNAKKDRTSITDIKAVTTKAARDYLKPELLGRVTEIVPFSSLSSVELGKIVNLEWGMAREWLEQVDATISIDDSLCTHMVDLSLESGYGARHLKRMVERYVVDALADSYLADTECFGGVGNKVSVGYTGTDNGCDVVSVVVGDDTHIYRVETSSITED
jgi:ATP-dependent Clp protease ATP-binding subunit ClpA